MGSTVSALCWIDLIKVFSLFDVVAIVTVVVIDIVLLALALGILPCKTSQKRSIFFASATFIEFSVFLFLTFLSHKLNNEITLTEIFKGFQQFFGVGVDENLASFAVFKDIFVKLLDAIIIDAPIVGVIGDETCKAIIPLQNGNLVVQGLNLLRNKLSDVDRLLLIIDFQFAILRNSLGEEFLLIDLKKVIKFLDDLLLILLQLIVDTFSHARQIVEDAVVGSAQLLEDHDVLVAFLAGVPKCFLQVDIGGLVVFEEVLLSVFDDAVGAERHEALLVTAEVGQEFVGVVGAEDLSGLAGLIYS